MFGREGTEEIETAELVSFVSGIFENSLGNLRKVGDARLSRLLAAKASLLTACSEFEKSDSEPYLEDLYNTSPESVKARKASYARSIEKAVGAEWRGNGANTYERLKGQALESRNAISTVLKLNSEFRTVVYAYSNSLQKVKKAFSELESALRTLEIELSRKEADYERYRAVMEEAEELSLLIEERRGAELRIKNPGAGPKETDLHELDIETEMRKVQNEREDTERARSAIIRKAESFTKPLERTARMFDHTSLDKRRIEPFVAEPFSYINTEDDWNYVKGKFVEIRSSQEVAARGGGAVANALDSLISSDLWREKCRLTEINSALERLDERLRSLRRDYELAVSLRERAAYEVTMVSRAQEVVEEINGKISRLSTAIEQAVMKEYGRRIRVSE